MAAPAFVKEATANGRSWGLGTPLSVTISPTAGNFLLVAVAYNSATGSVNNIAATGGGSLEWSQLSTIVAQTGAKSALYLCFALTGTITAITVDTSTATANGAVNVSEWTNIHPHQTPPDTASRIWEPSSFRPGVSPGYAFGIEDGIAVTNSATTGNPATGTSTTGRETDDLIFAMYAHNGTGTQSTGPTNSFTGLTSAGSSGGSGSTNARVGAAYLLPGATGGYTTAWTMSASTVAQSTIIAVIRGDTTARQRFYWHNANTSAPGATLPGASTVSTLTAGETVSGASTNRSMNETPGVSQVAVARSGSTSQDI